MVKTNSLARRASEGPEVQDQLNRRLRIPAEETGGGARCADARSGALFAVQWEREVLDEGVAGDR